MRYLSAKDEDMQSQLRSLAQEVVSEITAVDPARSRELLSAFVSELVLAVADESRREERRQRQAEGIAAAKARGVRFGRPAAPSSRRRMPAASPEGPSTALPSAENRLGAAPAEKTHGPKDRAGCEEKEIPC